MSPSTLVRQMGWTRRSAALSILSAVAEQRTKSAARLAEAMRAAGYKQERLALEAGVAVKTVSRWLNGRHEPREQTVQRVAKVLGVDPHWLSEAPAPLGIRPDGSSELHDLNTKLDALLDYFKIDLPEEAARAAEEALEGDRRERAARKRPARSARTRPANGTG